MKIENELGTPAGTKEEEKKEDDFLLFMERQNNPEPVILKNRIEPDREFGPLLPYEKWNYRMGSSGFFYNPTVKTAEFADWCRKVQKSMQSE